MLWFKCNSCGHVISEQEVGDLARQVLGGGDAFGTFTYKTCMKCGGKDIESAESVSNIMPPPQFSSEIDTQKENESSNSSDSGGGCFIATAAFNSPFSEEVTILRYYRDEKLLKSNVGRAFISFYYFVSPSIANIISKSKIMRSITRSILHPFVQYCRHKNE